MAVSFFAGHGPQLLIRGSANSGACLAGQFTKASLQRRTKFGDGAHLDFA
jgi:hypothetical protein